MMIFDLQTFGFMSYSKILFLASTFSKIVKKEVSQDADGKIETRKKFVP